MARYEVGSVVPFLFVRVKQFYNFRNSVQRVRWTTSLCNLDEIEEVAIMELTCMSEHQVSDGYSDEKIHTGYIFHDNQGRPWHNQYPHASYGQLSDAGNWMCRAGGDVEDYTQEEFDMMGLSGARDATYLLMDLVRAVSKTALNDPKDIDVSKVCEHYWAIENALYAKGYESHFKERVIKSSDPEKIYRYNSVEIVKR